MYTMMDDTWDSFHVNVRRAFIGANDRHPYDDSAHMLHTMYTIFPEIKRCYKYHIATTQLYWNRICTTTHTFLAYIGETEYTRYEYNKRSVLIKPGQN